MFPQTPGEIRYFQCLEWLHWDNHQDFYQVHPMVTQGQRQATWTGAQCSSPEVDSGHGDVEGKSDIKSRDVN